MKTGRVNERNIGDHKLDGDSKNRKTKKGILSDPEKHLIASVIERILGNVEFNEVISEHPHHNSKAKFTSNESLSFTLTREQMEMLTDALIKIS